MKWFIKSTFIIAIANTLSNTNGLWPKQWCLKTASGVVGNTYKCLQQGAKDSSRSDPNSISEPTRKASPKQLPTGLWSRAVASSAPCKTKSMVVCSGSISEFRTHNYHKVSLGFETNPMGPVRGLKPRIPGRNLKDNWCSKFWGACAASPAPTSNVRPIFGASVGSFIRLAIKHTTLDFSAQGLGKGWTLILKCLIVWKTAN